MERVKQNTAGRAIGHGLALVQAGSEIVGGVSAMAGGSGEAIVTFPACGTGRWLCRACCWVWR